MIDAATLRDLLDYDQTTGVFTWRMKRNGTHAGAVAGVKNHKGYIRIGICRRCYMAHRLAWLYVYGTWPQEQIDHINLAKSDNRISNLRIATNSQNHANRGRNANNTSGVKGVIWDKHRRKWLAQITVNGAHKYLGRFEHIETATEAYCRAAAQFFGEFGRAGPGARL